MASKIESRNIYVPITPYKPETPASDECTLLSVTALYSERSRSFDVVWHAGWGSGSMFGCMFDFSDNPLTGSVHIKIQESPRNSQKFIDQMHKNLNKDVHYENIRLLFDRREWEKLKDYLKQVALTGEYTGDINPQSSTQTPNPQTTMEATNMKAADLIGRTILVGTNPKEAIASIHIVSADGDNLQGEWSQDGTSTTQMPVPLATLIEQIKKGLWHLEPLAEAEQVETPDQAEAAPAPEPTPIDEVEEVTDAEPTATSNDSEPSEETTSSTEEPAPNDEEDDPIMVKYREAKAAHPDHIIIFRLKSCYTAVANDAYSVSSVVGRSVQVRNGNSFVVITESDLQNVFQFFVAKGRHIAIEDAPTDEQTSDEKVATSEEPKVATSEEPKAASAGPRVKPRTAQKEEQPVKETTDQAEEPVETPTDEQPKTQPRKSETTLAPEDGTPRILKVSEKCIVIAGDTTKIEAVLTTLWGRRRPYTSKGKSYSGIQMSAKHTATVKEIIKLAYAG